MDEIILNNKGTFSEWGLRMTSRPSNPANVKRDTYDIMQTQGVVDLSRGVNGEPLFEERRLPYSFSRVVNDFSERERMRYEISQWAYQRTDGILIDTSSEDYYFKETTCVGLTFGELTSRLFTVNISFATYPLRISRLQEGHGIWDEVVLSEDVFQHNVFITPRLEEQLPLKRLSVGDLVTPVAWVSRAGGVEFSPHLAEKFYEIGEIRQNTFPTVQHSVVEYFLKGINIWLNDIFIVQTYKPVEVELYNLGVSTVIPEVFDYTRGYSTPAGINIETETGEVYKLSGVLLPEGIISSNTFNDKVALKPGLNKWKLYGLAKEIRIIWHKEVV